jgi:hypothetical protein
MRLCCIVAVLVLVLLWSACRISTPSSVGSGSFPVLSFDDLEQGDFVWDRTPPFIPGGKLKPFLDKRVCIDGEYSYNGSGIILLTRPKERWLTPMSVIVCNPAPPSPPDGLYIGRVCGVLRIRPRNDSAGRLETVYQLDECIFEPSQTRALP